MYGSLKLKSKKFYCLFFILEDLVFRRKMFWLNFIMKRKRESSQQNADEIIIFMR